MVDGSDSSWLLQDPELLTADATIHAFRRNAFVAASAGTGKTYRLTALYVLLNLGMTSMGQRDARTAAPAIGPERIVATTFSRAAAGEIGSRVETALRQLAAWDGSAPLPFQEVLAARSEAIARPLERGELQKRANAALGRWSAARIDTLHGVARRVVESASLAIGLAPDLRILEEEESQSLADLAVDEALSRALTEGGARAEAARALMVSTGGVGPARFRVQRLLDRLDEEGLGPLDLVIADHLADARVAAARVRALAGRLSVEGSAGLREPAVALAGALSRARADELLPEDAVGPLAEILTRRLPPRSKRTAVDDDLEELIDGLSGKTKGERAAGLIAWLQHAPTLGAREARLVDLLDDARARFTAAKRRASALGFGDLLRIARDTLRDEREIARDAREEIDALLVDEFQDTSRVQRDLVYLLRERDDAAEARAQGAPPLASGLVGHGLFVVGDRKQSIYGFRGADVAVFSRVAVELAGARAKAALAIGGMDDPMQDAGERAAEPVADFVALRESRRSGAAILAFVNAFSTRDFVSGAGPGPARPFEITYGPAEHLVAAREIAKPGRVVFVADDGSSPDDAEPIVRESAGAAREAHVAAAYVASLTHGASEPLAYRDVAVLARRRSTIPLLEVALGRLEIPYVVAGRALYDTAEVRDIAALLRLLLDPRDRFAMAVVLRGPMVALSDGALAQLSIAAHGLSVPLLGRWRAASRDVPGPSSLPPAERARLEAFRARFAEVRGPALRLPPADAIRAAMAAFDLDRVLATLPRAEARIGNLDRLVTIARRRSGTLASFVRWLERRIRDDTDEAEAAVFSKEDDAVRLTTIHASKGLDFPAVVLVDINAEPRADPGGVGFVSDGERAVLAVRHYAARPRFGSSEDRSLVTLGTATMKAALSEARAREQAERRRLTYVAITRARQTLAIIGSPAPPRPSAALHTLGLLLSEPATEGLVAVEPATDVLARATPAPRRSSSLGLSRAQASPRGPVRPGAREIVIDAADLALYRGCPRRYRLRCVLGLAEEPRRDQLDLFAPPSPSGSIAGLPPPVADDPALDPRPLGRAAHRVLARWPAISAEIESLVAALALEGLPVNEAETRRLAAGIAAFAGGKYLSEASASAYASWDDPFAAVISGGQAAPRLVVRGVADLRVDHADGIDLVAVLTERAPGETPRVALGLRACALSVARANPSARVRIGTLTLGTATEPRWQEVSTADHDRLEAELSAVAVPLAASLHQGSFAGRERPECERLGCGFIAACHPS